MNASVKVLDQQDGSCFPFETVLLLLTAVLTAASTAALGTAQVDATMLHFKTIYHI